METMTYQPPLRGAVLFAVGMDRGAVSVETIAEIAQVAENRARAFASILVARGALIETSQGFVQGNAWGDWSSRPSRSRPSHTSDRKALDDIDQMRRNIANRVRRELAQRQWSIRELARRARGIHHSFVASLVRYNTTPPACQMIFIAEALGLTIEELAASPA